MTEQASRLSRLKAEATVLHKGADAARAGVPIESCPYKVPKQSFNLYVHRYRQLWMQGYKSVKS